jgi:hypothetical protein
MGAQQIPPPYDKQWNSLSAVLIARGNSGLICLQYLRHLNGVDWAVNPPQLSHLGNHLINTNRLWHFRKQF